MTCPWALSKESRFRDRIGLIMYLPTLSASCLLVALTLLWTWKPLWRQLNIFSTSVKLISCLLNDHVQSHTVFRFSHFHDKIIIRRRKPRLWHPYLLLFCWKLLREEDATSKSFLKARLRTVFLSQRS
jgi:hypothetical protein